MAELTVGQQFMIGIVGGALLLGIISPWLSLTSLNKLSDIAYELRKIREELERRAE